MKRIQVLGPGCAKCVKLAELAEQAAQELGVEHTLEKVTDIADIMRFRVLMTPALVVDGEVKCMGKIPAVSQLKEMLS